MLKKVLFAVVLALSFLSAVGLEANSPPPTCGMDPKGPDCPLIKCPDCRPSK